MSQKVEDRKLKKDEAKKAKFSDKKFKRYETTI